MKIIFKEHQNKVLNFFKESNTRGLLLYHGLGSGKTITSIGVTELYKNDVVCIVPASMRTQWKNELKKVGVKNKYDIYSYEEISLLINKYILSLNNNKSNKSNNKSNKSK